MLLPRCEAVDCGATQRWVIEFVTLPAQSFVIRRLCGRHARLFRLQRRCASWSVTDLRKIEYAA